MNSLEDHARMKLAGKPGECLCVEFATLIQTQAEEIKRLNDIVSAYGIRVSELEGQFENIFNMD